MDTMLEELDVAARWLEEYPRDPHSDTFLLPPAIVLKARRNYVLKRIFDIGFASLAIILLSPLLLILIILVRATSPGPAIFRQSRVGEGGRPFTFYKFRSMRRDAGDAIHRAAAARFLHGQKVADGLNGYKLARDPRVTHLGAILRATSLDELPQLFNILKGDMSFVGPRPPVPYEVDHYRYRHHYRFLVKPGLTGIWQVYGRSRVDFETLVSMDLHYVTDGTLWLDIKLILLTVGVVLRRSGGR
jgi:lipopolysaccharide/colanic/teichoic acid biosynthesis glycosyltransferase